MLNIEEHSGVITAMGGLVVLVLVGVGLSMAVEGRFRSSSNSVVLKREISDQRDLMQELEMELEKQEFIFGNQKRFSPEEAASFDHLLKSIGSNSEEIILLDTQRSDLEAGLGLSVNEFEEYRISFREYQSKKATGEKFDQIVARNGRIYKDVTIARVTLVGIEISHENGIARIGAPDLGPEWQERFQWSDEERREQLEKERLFRERMTKPKVELKVSAENHRTTSLPRRMDHDKRDEIRRALLGTVRKWDLLLASLDAELAEAQVAAQGHASIPGSLETWQTRSKKISLRIKGATRERQLAKAKLDELYQ